MIRDPRLQHRSARILRGSTKGQSSDATQTQTQTQTRTQTQHLTQTQTLPPGGAVVVTGENAGAPDAFDAARGTAQELAQRKTGTGGARGAVQAFAPSKAELQRVLDVAAAALRDVPGLTAPAIGARLLHAGVTLQGTSSFVAKLPSTSPQQLWADLTRAGRALLVPPRGLGGLAVAVDGGGRLLIDAKAWLGLPAQERKLQLVSAVFAASFGREDQVLYGQRTSLADVLARALLGSGPVPPQPCPGGRVHYPAGGNDEASASLTRGLLDKVTDVYSLDFNDSDTRTAQGARAVRFHNVKGDALAEDIAGQIGGPAGAMVLQAPGEFGALRNDPRFLARNLDAIAVGGTVLNCTVWGYAPLARCLPLSFFGLEPRGSVPERAGASYQVELFVKTRAVPVQRLEALTAVDRLTDALLRWQAGNPFMPRLEKGWLTRETLGDRQADASLLPELADLARHLDTIGDPAVAACVWAQLQDGAGRSANIGDAERAFIAERAAALPAPEPLPPASLPVTSAPSSDGIDAIGAALAAAQQGKLPALPAAALSAWLISAHNVWSHAHPEAPGAGEAPVKAIGRALWFAELAVARELAHGSVDDFEAWPRVGGLPFRSTGFKLVLAGEEALLKEAVAAVDAVEQRLRALGPVAGQHQKDIDAFRAGIDEARAKLAASG